MHALGQQPHCIGAGWIRLLRGLHDGCGGLPSGKKQYWDGATETILIGTR
jgi:hypothetical protein